MKTSVLEEWNFIDLYEKKFWEKIIPPNNPFQFAPPGVPFFIPQPGEFVQPPVDFWSFLPKKIQSKFSDNRDIFDFWLDVISESEYYVFTESIRNKKWKSFELGLKDNKILNEIQKDSKILSDISMNKKQQRFGKFDTLFIEFLETSKKSDAILLNTEDLVFLGGRSKLKISEAMVLMKQRGLELVQELNYKIDEKNKKKTIYLMVLAFKKQNEDT